MTAGRYLAKIRAGRDAMKQTAHVTLVVLTLAVAGCSEASDSELIAPRATNFKPGVTLAVYTTAKVSGPSTISRLDPVSGEILHLAQPALVAMNDVKSTSIMEAPGQWPIVTVAFDQPTAIRMAREAKAGGGRIAVVVNNKVLSTLPAGEQPINTLALRSVIGGPDISGFVD